MNIPKVNFNYVKINKNDLSLIDFNFTYQFRVTDKISIIFGLSSNDGGKYFLTDETGNAIELKNISPKTSAIQFEELRRLSNNFIYYEYQECIPLGRDNHIFNDYKGILNLELTPIIEFSDRSNSAIEKINKHNNMNSCFTDFDNFGFMPIQIGDSWGAINDSGDWIIEPMQKLKNIFKMLKYQHPRYVL